LQRIVTSQVGMTIIDEFGIRKTEMISGFRHTTEAILCPSWTAPPPKILHGPEKMICRVWTTCLMESFILG
jgi:hypothetical protein